MSIPWCVCLTPHVLGQSKAAMLLASRWPEDSVIQISFLDGDPSVQERVRAAAQIWLEATRAPLTFSWRTDTTQTDIRISFRRSGSWSMLGTLCRDVDPREPTMNFGWLKPSSTDDEVREVVLHEFGHALGLIHEHQNPEGEIPWDREVVIAELSGPPNNWDEATIERNVLDGYDRWDVRSTPYDPTSIMHYPFPAHWRTDGVASASNSVLSPSDIALVKSLYPGP